MRSLGPIELGQNAPDLPDLGNAGSEQADNCLPRVNSYGPLQSLVDISVVPADSAVFAVTSFKDEQSDLPFTYAGIADDLLELVSDAGGGQPGFVSRGQLGINATDWEFARYGRDVVAVDINTLPQIITVGGLQFADLSPENMRARHVGVVRNFMMFGYVNDDDGLGEARVRWSAFNNIRDIVPSSVTLSDFQDLRGDGGSVMKVVGGTTGVIFQERAIWRAEFVGTPFIFRFDELEQNVGTIASGSVVRYGDRVFFMAEDGFRVVSPNQASQAIGEDRVDRKVYGELDTNALDRISARVLIDEQVVMWSYPGAGSGGRPNKLAMYNFASDRWSTGDEAVDCLASFATPFQSIDSFTGSIDDIVGSLDDAIYSGGVQQSGAITQDHQAAAAIGPAKTAEFTTKEIAHTPGRRTFVNHVRAVVDGGASRLQIGARNDQSQSPALTPWVDIGRGGLAPFRVNARYVRYRLEVQGEAFKALGVEPFGNPSGHY